MSYESMLVIANAGAVGTSIAVKLQESSDDGDADAYADITGATTGAVTTANTVYLIDVNLSEYERYIRAVATAVGVVLVGVVFVLGSGRHLPPGQDQTVVQSGYAQLA
jgi:fluoride ion exporter CrcB/FEX